MNVYVYIEYIWWAGWGKRAKTIGVDALGKTFYGESIYKMDIDAFSRISREALDSQQDFVCEKGICRIISNFTKKINMGKNAVSVKVMTAHGGREKAAYEVFALSHDKKKLDKSIKWIYSKAIEFENQSQFKGILKDLLENVNSVKEESLAILFMHEPMDYDTQEQSEIYSLIAKCKEKNIKFILLGLEDNRLSYYNDDIMGSGEMGLGKRHTVIDERGMFIDVRELQKYSTYPELCFKAPYDEMCAILKYFGHIIANIDNIDKLLPKLKRMQILERVKNKLLPSVLSFASIIMFLCAVMSFSSMGRNDMKINMVLSEFVFSLLGVIWGVKGNERCGSGLATVGAFLNALALLQSIAIIVFVFIL